MAAQPLLCKDTRGVLSLSPSPPTGGGLDPDAGGALHPKTGEEKADLGRPPLVPPRSFPSLAFSSSGLVAKTQEG